MDLVATLTLSSRASLLKPSPTLSITAKANALKAEGADVVSFAAGEPDFDTPDAIKDAAVRALAAGFTKYTPTSGIKDLKEAIVAKLARENGVSVTPEQVVVSAGAKLSVYEIMQILLDPGDEVLLIAPYWMTYAEQIRLAGGEPVVVQTTGQTGFIPSIDDIREAISSRTKAIIVNSPCNPTGAVFPRDTLEGLAALANRHGFWIVSDEIYERLVYGGIEQVSIASLDRETAERTITVNGCSKTFAMTGWRIGYLAAPTQVAKAVTNLQDQMTSNATSFAQKGAVQALKLDPAEVEKMRSEFEARRDLVAGLLSEIPRVPITVPGGAFYILPDFSAYLGGQVATDLDLAGYLLDEAQVATVPGSVFEAPGHLRLSYAASRTDIQKGVARIREALSKLQ